MIARELERILRTYGWTCKNTKGSHKQFVHPIKPGKITIPQHKGDIAKGTANAILKAAGLKGIEEIK